MPAGKVYFADAGHEPGDLIRQDLFASMTAKLMNAADLRVLGPVRSWEAGHAERGSGSISLRHAETAEGAIWTGRCGVRDTADQNSGASDARG